MSFKPESFESMKSQPKVEVFSPRDFLTKMLGTLGVESAQSLDSGHQGAILEAFHHWNCEVDLDKVAQLSELTESQKWEVFEMLVVRSAMMRDLAEMIMGYDQRTDGGLENELLRSLE